MEEWQKRVFEERDALNTKVLALSSFIFSNAFSKLDPVQRDLLSQQFRVMNEYISILTQRISFWMK